MEKKEGIPMTKRRKVKVIKPKKEVDTSTDVCPTCGHREIKDGFLDD